ncbi:MAG: class I SAM-dependent methyltransferase [Crocinitomicaceae bacterium]|nr:class I SAM-dependent methyltransferase [Crocinitomicaceae bacterium]
MSLVSKDENTKRVTQVFDTYSSMYQQRHMQVETYQSSLDLFCSYLTSENSSILEIGCGPGNITSYVLSKHPSLDILAIDLSKKMIALAKINNPSATFKVMDARKIQQISKSFQAVICGFILPYLCEDETEQLIKSISNSLPPQGMIYLSTMEGDYKNSGIQESASGEGSSINMFYYQENQLLSLLNDAGFEHLHTKRYPIENSKKNDLIVIAKKK